MYSCTCQKCNHTKQSLNLAIGKNVFKDLLIAVERAFKKLHQKGNYKPKDLANTKAYQDVIKETAKIFNYTLKDNKLSKTMLNSLQEDIFLFSGLKTHAQLFEASRQLLNKDKKIKPFEQFSRDITKLKTNYNRNYLEAEYDFALGSVQMAERWDNFSESDRYYLQYRTANDDKVRVTHQPLHEITLPKTDAFWDKYFPPNGWRCRCTTVEVLSYTNEPSDSKEAEKKGNKATTHLNKNGKNKLEIFRFNAGRQKVVFPPKHPYSKVAGAKKVKPITKAIVNNQERYTDITFEKVPGITNKGVLEIFTKGKQNKNEFKKNKKALTIVANKGGKYRMLPIINDDNKNPDALNLITKKFVDVKVADGTNGKNIIMNAMKGSSRQGASELLLHLTKKPDSYRKMYGALKYMIKMNRNKNVKTIVVIYPNKSIKEYKISEIKKRIK